ncbi:MAG: Asp23/Gls24 family envelope stress response protein [Clostridia bacterium]|nr:Asp23/Gls24 family envelope stress response protein [Clostridia bacterium]
MAKEETRTLPSDLGVVKISDEVVSIVAGLAATEIDGVASMSGGIAGGIAEVLGRRNLSKGVKVEVGLEETKIDIFIIVKYGVRVPDVAWDIQENVKKAVENMTGLKVAHVNVHVQGIQFPQKENEETESKAIVIEETE